MAAAYSTMGWYSIYMKYFLPMAFATAAFSASAEPPTQHHWYESTSKSTIWMVGKNDLTGTPVYASSPLHQAARFEPTNDIIVKTPVTPGIKLIEVKYGLSFHKKLSIGLDNYVFKTPVPADALEIANSIVENGDAVMAYPDWVYIEKAQ